MTATKVNGMWIVSEVIKGYLETHKYIGYTKREAVRMFRDTMKLKRKS